MAETLERKIGASYLFGAGWVASAFNVKSHRRKRTGVELVRKAIQSPARRIAENAGVDGSIVIGKILDKSDCAFGSEAQTGDYGDLCKLGIIDPTKVVRTALQDAASVASLLITTEAMIAEKPKEDTPAPALPGGGMDYRAAADLAQRRRPLSAGVVLSWTLAEGKFCCPAPLGEGAGKLSADPIEVVQYTEPNALPCIGYATADDAVFALNRVRIEEPHPGGRAIRADMITAEAGSLLPLGQRYFAIAEFRRVPEAMARRCYAATLKRRLARKADRLEALEIIIEKRSLRMSRRRRLLVRRLKALNLDWKDGSPDAGKLLHQCRIGISRSTRKALARIIGTVFRRIVESEARQRKQRQNNGDNDRLRFHRGLPTL